MLRVLAYTRTIDQVPEAVRPYCSKDDWGPQKLIQTMKKVQIVVATVNLAARFTNLGEGLQKGHFDVVCIDEAGHATEPEVIGVIAPLMNLCGKNPGQVIMAGDPCQLGPIITSSICQEYGMGMSYMERLVKESPAYSTTGADGEVSYPPQLVTMLIRNYRSHPAILKLPNEMFYHNKLLSCGDFMTTHSMAKWEHLPPNNDRDFPIVFHAVDGLNDREGSSPSWFNVQEVVTVVEYVEKLVKQSKPSIKQEDIGIITPYARQVQKIRLALKAKGFDESLKVGSVETFQGQERRCIIISTVRSEQSRLDHDRKYNLGFVANEKRFNVAVTRAKALLVVIGNPRVLATDKKNWLPFLKYCQENESWTGEDWIHDDESPDEDEIEKLVTEGGTRADNNDDNDDEWEVVPDQVPRGFINREE
jgi:superfamily I DNA and/or RNA helicase